MAHRCQIITELTLDGASTTSGHVQCYATLAAVALHKLSLPLLQITHGILISEDLDLTTRQKILCGLRSDHVHAALERLLALVAAVLADAAGGQLLLSTTLALLADVVRRVIS